MHHGIEFDLSGSSLATALTYIYNQVVFRKKPSEEQPEALLTFFFFFVRIVSVLIWNQHPNIRLDDPIIRGSDLHTIHQALDFR